MKKNRLKPFLRTFLGTLYFGFTVGVATGILIVLFKYAAAFAIKSSSEIYGFLSAKPYFLPLARAVLLGF